MQEEAAKKLDELLTPIDVSQAMKDLKERQSAYPSRTANHEAGSRA
jgi:hypothetical protein